MTATGPVVLVAGVGPGLGTALVATLATAGATVVALARTPDHLASLTEHARQRGWSFEAVAADASVPADVARALETTLGHHGRLDGVVMAIGRWMRGSRLLHESTDEEWRDGIAGNLDAAFVLLRPVLAQMTRQARGSIVLVAAAPEVRAAGTAAYAAGKAGILELTAKLARDYRASGVRVNVVLPGNMAKEVDPDPPSPVERVPLLDSIPSSPWEVARAIRFLVLSDARWITGASLTVDGGLSTHGDAEPSPTP